MSDFVKELNFDGDTFNDMKRDMNFVLQRLLGNMQEKRMPGRNADTETGCITHERVCTELQSEHSWREQRDCEAEVQSQGNKPDEG